VLEESRVSSGEASDCLQTSTDLRRFGRNYSEQSSQVILWAQQKSARLRGMKRPKPATAKASARGTSDAYCKRLAEEYPAQFAHWLFGASGPVKVEKTELTREPIRADAAIFSHADNEILHIEFQTTMQSDVPIPLRFLDYYVGFKRQHPARRVRQVLVILTPTDEAIPDRYEDEYTTHRYLVVKLWEQDPAALLQHEGLLPLATLCRTASGETLLNEVAGQINQIKSSQRRREAMNWSRVLAGLRYNKRLIFETLKENDMLEESVIYQDIFKKGEKRGKREGRQEEGQLIVQRLLERRFGKLTPGVLRQIEGLAVAQLEELCEALLEFQTRQDMVAWFKQHARKN
jgi:predicted transposase YdaD